MRVLIVLSVDILPNVTALEFGRRVLQMTSLFSAHLDGLASSRVRLVGTRGLTRPLTTTIQQEIARCLSEG